jgi:D-alanine-D-alanine ligase
MAKIRVAVLMGGRSAEREVSLSTGRQVLAALDPARYEAFPVDTASLGVGALRAPEASAAEERAGPRALFGPDRPDVAFICLHGRFGEDGTVQGMLELLEIPYVGSGVLASALAINKVMAKKLFRLEGIPTPDGVSLRGRRDADAFLRAWEAGAAPVSPPAVVKPSNQGSTIGISIVREGAAMAAALNAALAYDRDILVEEFIQGIEITGPVLGNDELTCLPLVEIVPSSGFYDYEAKYTPGATEEIVPARLSEAQTRAAKELAIRAHRALGCRGFSRADMLVAEDGIRVLEVNTIPGMTPTSLLPRSAEAAGISFPQLVDRIIQLALEGSREPTPAAPS